MDNKIIKNAQGLDQLNTRILQVQNFPANVTTNIGTTDQNNKALAYKDGVLIVGSANGKIEYSLDNGLTWSADVATHPFTTNQITCIAFSPVVAGLVAAVSVGGVIGISTDYGATFAALANSHGGSDLNWCEFDVNGLLHVCGASGKYSKSTTSACTAMSALIDVGFGSVIADRIYCGPDFMMISGHSNKLNRSTDWGTTWSGLITTGFDALDALWNVVGDGGSIVVVAVYDSSAGNKGKYIVSTDKGVTWSALKSSFFTTATIRILRVQYAGGLWVFTGDSAYMGYTHDISNTTLTRIVYHQMSTGIVFNSVWTGKCFILSGATGRVGRSLII